MSSHFLCNYHRAWLTAHPQAAIAHLQQCIHSASVLRQAGAWSRALPHLGSAFEAATLLLDCVEIDLQLAATELTSSALLLADNYYRMSHFHQGREVVNQSITLLVAVQQRDDVFSSVRLSGCINLLHKKLTDFFSLERRQPADQRMFKLSPVVH